MMLDVFKSDAFQFTKLVAAINKLPYVPTRIGSMGLFSEEGVSTLSVAVEMQNGVLTLVPTAPRGSRGPAKDLEKRTVRDFRTTSLPQTVTVMADEVVGLRAFGSETDEEMAMSYLLKKMAVARRDLDLTHEYQRMGALKGIVLDADGSTPIYNYFTEFGVSQQVLDFELDSDTTIVRKKCVAVERLIEDALGGVMYSGLHAFVSGEFFDALIDHVSVTDTYKGTMDAATLRGNLRKTFEFGGITFEEYRGSVGGTRFIAAGDGYVFPLGVPELYKSFFSPAPYMDTVGTNGLPFYMKGRNMDFDTGLDYAVTSHPLHMVTRPESVVRITLT
jgi:hypothetical protein